MAVNQQAVIVSYDQVAGFVIDEAIDNHVIRQMLNLEASSTYGGTHEIHGLVLGKTLTQESAF